MLLILYFYKCFHVINFVTLLYILTNSLKMMYKHQNMQQCYKKQILLIYIVYLLDR